jgi:hypothetical protein
MAAKSSRLGVAMVFGSWILVLAALLAMCSSFLVQIRFADRHAGGLPASGRLSGFAFGCPEEVRRVS